MPAKSDEVKSLRKVLIFCFALCLILGIPATFWFNTQPVWSVDGVVTDEELDSLPGRNKAIIEFVEAKGKDLAPTYKDAVCTEFVINVLDSLDALTKSERNDIRIITTLSLDSLIEVESPIIKGVQTALLKNHKGIAIDESKNVLPGDFVQFWNVFQGKAYGHCGIVLDIEPGKTLTLYSSHPITGGFGKQMFMWPDQTYFVRLRE